MGFIDRLIAEKRELDERIEKLGSFIDGGRIGDLPIGHRALLLEQRTVMTMYSEILGRRLALLEVEVGEVEP